MFENKLVAKAERVLQQAREKAFKITTAESCTGGLVAAALTSIAGCSDVFERGFVTYSNEAKTTMIGVPEELLRKHGAVSEEVAASMARGAAKHSNADIAVSVTGVAGPGGGGADKPVGLVYIGVFLCGTVTVTKNLFDGDRESVRSQTVIKALDMVLEAIGQ
jgi:nicotinamide-nucleotide amidase